MKKIPFIISVTLALFLLAGFNYSAFAATHTNGFWKNITQKYGKVLVGKATVDSISGQTLIVTKNGKNYTVNTNSNTVIFRRFFGKSNLSQLSIGDMVNIRGSWTDTSDTAINADFIRDTAIQDRNDTFSGTVTSLNTNGFVLASKHRGSLTVTIENSTKLTDKNGSSISFGEIVVNDNVIVKGMWDRNLKTITFVNFVKDNTIPR